MRAVLVNQIMSVETVQTRFGMRATATITFNDEPMQQFWMSVKQGRKLQDCFDELKSGYSTKRAECHIILDDGDKGERFVWCGIHSPKKSDLKFLEAKFGVKCESPYVGRYDLEVDAPAVPDESLKDE